MQPVIKNKLEKQVGESESTDLSFQRQAIQHHLAECSRCTLVGFFSYLYVYHRQ